MSDSTKIQQPSRKPGGLFFYHNTAPFLFRQGRCPKEAAIGEALSSWPATAPEPPSPMYPTRLALTMARSILTYTLNTAKMFRFLRCSGSVSGIRQAANRNICELSRNFTGLSGFGGVVYRRGRLCKKPPPIPLSLSLSCADTRKGDNVRKKEAAAKAAAFDITDSFPSERPCGRSLHGPSRRSP